MTIGEVTARLGVPDSTIRYCEKMDPVDLRHRVSSHRRFHDRALVTRRFANPATECAKLAGWDAPLPEPPHSDRPGGDPS